MNYLILKNSQENPSIPWHQVSLFHWKWGDLQSIFVGTLIYIEWYMYLSNEWFCLELPLNLFDAEFAADVEWIYEAGKDNFQ